MIYMSISVVNTSFQVKVDHTKDVLAQNMKRAALSSREHLGPVNH